MNAYDEIVRAIQNGYVDDTVSYSTTYVPEFLFNLNENGNICKVFDGIKENLKDCDEFIFSVAFINDAGINLFKLIFAELEKNNIPGKVLTSDYLCFSEPVALRTLLNYKNIETRMIRVNETGQGFHTKCYIFRYGTKYKIIIGSSNLTLSALTKNDEWNNQIICSKEGKIYKEISSQFNRLWNKASPLSLVLDDYEKEYKNSLVNITPTGNISVKRIFKPNSMQVEFISSLNESIKRKDSRGLLISATGTGKTFASAFGLREIRGLKVNKMLFVTHRETILKQAKETYEIVFENTKKCAILSGNNHDVEGADFVFATLNTIREEKYLKLFSVNEFDFIIIDEVHRVGDNTYQDVINYFQPKYLLGMSATPDRTDGYNLYKLFNYNILYEIRLDDALNASMLAPFCYWGIKDLFIDNKEYDDFKKFNALTSDERVKYILDTSSYYGYSGDKLRCLMFVSSIEEGKELSRKINLTKRAKSIFICGKDSLDFRIKAIDLFEETNINNDYLDIIITVDVFNEGVDIPSVNQIIFLRPTQSSIVFLQQLGRGLRLYPNKRYVNVIDFIANYDNNYKIPMIFQQKGSGGTSKIVKAIKFPQLPGACYVQFDRIAEERIFDSIKKNKIYQSKNIYQQYLVAKNRYGRIPSLIEYDEAGKEISSRVFLDLSGYDSYYEFLLKVGEIKYILSEQERDTLKYLSSNIGNGMRIHEPLLLKYLIDGLGYSAYCLKLKELGFTYDFDVFKSVVAILNTSFNKTESTKTKEVSTIKVINSNLIELSDEFKEMIKNINFKKHVEEIIDYALYAFNLYYKETISSKLCFKLFNKYTRKDVSRLINLEKNHSSIMYGYKIYPYLNIAPLFVTYEKKLDKASSINYEDHFNNPNTFTWFSRNKLNVDSSEIKALLNVLNNNGHVLLFIKKEDIKNSKNDENSFYFVGECILKSYENAKMQNEASVVKFIFNLKNSVDLTLYKYLENI